MKEMLRLLLKIKDVDEAESELKRWLWWASHSRIPAFKALYQKIKRHKEHILTEEPKRYSSYSATALVFGLFPKDSTHTFS